MIMDSSEEKDESDYMSMTIIEPDAAKYESSVQRQRRLRQEAESRAQQKPKAERAIEQAQARENALNSQLDKSSKGYKMLSRLGYKPGTTLGAKGNADDNDARLEPIAIEVKEDRSGIGHGAERKRKYQQQVQTAAKRAKEEVSDFRQRSSEAKVSHRNEALWRSAMSTLEAFEEEQSPDDDQQHVTRISGTRSFKALKDVNILYRSLVQSRLKSERESKLQKLITSDVVRDALRSDAEGNAHTSQAFSEHDLEESDGELSRLQSQDPGVRFLDVVTFLRERYHYCFWCKHAYSDSQMEGCPGETEEAHD